MPQMQVGIGVKNWGGNFTRGSSMVFDSLDNIYITGDFYLESDFNPNPSLTTNLFTY